MELGGGIVELGGAMVEAGEGRVFSSKEWCRICLTFASTGFSTTALTTLV